MTNENQTNLEALIIDMAVENWRFFRLFIKVASKLDAGETAKYVSQLRYFQKKIEDSLESIGLKLVNLESQTFDTGMAVSVINMDDFGPEDLLEIDQMVEPVIMGTDGVRRPGTVLVRKVKLL
jgi:hypothetical protein